YDFNTANRLYDNGRSFVPASLLEGSSLAPHGVANPQVQSLMSRCGIATDDAFESYGNAFVQSQKGLRERLRQAMKLLNDAGYYLKGSQLGWQNNGSFVPVRLTILAYDETEVRQILLYKDRLSRLGIELNLMMPQSPDAYSQIVSQNDYDIAAGG